MTPRIKPMSNIFDCAALRDRHGSTETGYAAQVGEVEDDSSSATLFGCGKGVLVIIDEGTLYVYVGRQHVTPEGELRIVDCGEPLLCLPLD